jgi:hypothetical protein
MAEGDVGRHVDHSVIEARRFEERAGLAGTDDRHRPAEVDVPRIGSRSGTAEAVEARRDSHRAAVVHRGHRVAERAIPVRAAPVEGVGERVHGEDGRAERGRGDDRHRDERPDHDRRQAGATHVGTLPVSDRALKPLAACADAFRTRRPRIE